MPTRRRFLHLVASGVAAESLLPHCEPLLDPELLHAELLAMAQDGEVHLKKRPSRLNKSYGSGSFGNWIADPQGLPCFEYLTNQTEDPAATVPVEAAWRAPTDHTHQVGNDRIVAAVSNYGYLQVRQDEGGPKFLNDYRPDEGLFGAGLGYLTDGKEILGTYYPGNGTSFERFFGIGYARKRVVGTNFSVDQTIYAPFGDDPVLISEATISSQAPATANLHWAEYWGCQCYPFSRHAFLDGELPGALGDQPDPARITGLRREFARRYEHRFARLEGAAALVESKTLRPGASRRRGTAIPEEVDLRAFDGVSFGQDAAEPPVPPATFLAALEDGPVGFLTNSTDFFGRTKETRHVGAAGPESVPVFAGLLQPAILGRIVPGEGVPVAAIADDLAASGPDSALILVKPFLLEAGQSVTLRFLYGYLPEGLTAANLIAKYRGAGPALFAKSCAAWKDEGIQLAVASEPGSELRSDAWIERETRWHSYCLRSGFAYDDFFGEHIVSQGGVYQYCQGLRTAPRDPLQHALPLVFGESELAKQVLRHTLKSQRVDGSLPAAIAGFGEEIAPQPPPSDLNLWLLWLASEYVLGTRDTGFLEERLTTYPWHRGDPLGGPRYTVREKLDHAFRYLVANVGTGAHGLLRGRGGDWNEQIYLRNIPESLHGEVAEHSESVMNAAMAAYIFDHYARMLRCAGDLKAADEAAGHAERQRVAVRAQWAGRWFRRLWLGPAQSWLTEDRMWLEAQPWALLGGCATAEQQRILVQSIEELTRKPSRIGAKQLGYPPGAKRIDWPGVVAGETKNGGIYDTITGPLIWALARLDPEMGDAAMAFDEWVKNSRARHAEVYPDVWYGAWSGPDLFCSADSDHVGQTGYDWGLVDPDAAGRPSSYRGLSWTAWPVMNMHRHAWPLYSAAKLCGIEFTEAGLDLRPAVPKERWSFRSKLVGLEKTAKGYEGWYAPKKAGSYAIRLKIAAGEAIFKTLIVNGRSRPAPAGLAGNVEFSGDATTERPLRWSLLR
jgi:hypothetical protein